jgi:hypothetical protein
LLNRRRLLLLPLMLVALLAAAIPTVGAARSKSGSHKASSSSVTIGIQNATADMFASPLYTQLRTKITRYIAPYDAAVVPRDLAFATAYIQAAQAQGEQVLVAFYHSRNTPLRNPSVKAYTSDVTKFIQKFPTITQFQPWDEANRGTIRGLEASPDAKLAAQYYVALRRVLGKAKSCRRGCTDVGLDVLDQSNDKTTLKYISQFDAEVRHLHKPLPTVWGLHNYSDTNRFSDSRTKRIIKHFPGNGQVWITETGGIVQFGNAFPKSLSRASRAIKQMITDARSNPRIRRLYVFNWTPEVTAVRFDSGLVDGQGHPRPAYFALCKYVNAVNCSTSFWASKGLPEANS